MSPITLEQLHILARQRADMVNNDFIEDGELTNYINQSIAELYDLIIMNFEDDYVEDHIINHVGIDTRYPLPSDFYKLITVHQIIPGVGYIPLSKFNRKHIPSINICGTLMYRLRGSQVQIIGTGNTNEILLTYIPVAPHLVEPSDTLDVIRGWEEFVVIDSAIKMLVKEESDVRVLFQQKADIINRIKESASMRDLAATDSIQDVTSVDYFATSRLWR